jgi:hypothetical protein
LSGECAVAAGDMDWRLDVSTGGECECLVVSGPQTMRWMARGETGIERLYDGLVGDILETIRIPDHETWGLLPGLLTHIAAFQSGAGNGVTRRGLAGKWGVSPVPLTRG